MNGAQKGTKMVRSIKTSRDVVLERLISDKNKLYTKYKHRQKECIILKNEVKYLKEKNKTLNKQNREYLNELLELKQKENIECQE